METADDVRAEASFADEGEAAGAAETSDLPAGGRPQSPHTPSTILPEQPGR